jgi:hypothetical protein
MMKLADLSQETLEKIKPVRWNRIIEKREGPEDWESVLRWYEPEFLPIDDRPVLLPVERDHHPNITILRSIWSADGNVLARSTTHRNGSAANVPSLTWLEISSVTLWTAGRSSTRSPRCHDCASTRSAAFSSAAVLTPQIHLTNTRH